MIVTRQSTRMVDRGEAPRGTPPRKRVACTTGGLSQLPALKVNGRLTRDENVADLAGLELARAALLAAMPGGGVDADKAFYTGWAQVWAQQVTAEEAQRRALQDVRAPGEWRTNAPILQQGAFGTAFGCKVGTPMHPKPEARISIFR